MKSNSNKHSTYLNGMVKPENEQQPETPIENRFKKEHPILYKILGLLAFIVGYIVIGMLKGI